MKYSQAASYFSHVSLVGQAGATWVPISHKVTILPYDRSIDDREGNYVRRKILCPYDKSLDYTVVKTAEDVVYIVGSLTRDIYGDATYSKIYEFEEASGLFEILRPTVRQALSGVKSTAVLQPVGQVYGRHYRVGEEVSNIDKMTKISKEKIFLPRDCGVTQRDVLSLAGVEYHVGELYFSYGYLVAEVRT